MSERWTPLVQADTLVGPDGVARPVPEGQEYWANEFYSVRVRRGQHLVHLSYHRRDREAVRDWRHGQAMKNQLVGPEFEGLELYPAESRLVDTSTEFHLWVFLDSEALRGVGFDDGRVVMTPEEAARYGATQRPFDEPLEPEGPDGENDLQGGR